ncbi:MAG TPA: CBS domain-containing protein [Candidatus Polarisedimenticolia bacterium]|jgi:CBS domain-containing protein|nr:CBS domain-containing protein [Candidatus Polarisedimenticolia bacterium]
MTIEEALRLERLGNLLPAASVSVAEGATLREALAAMRAAGGAALLVCRDGRAVGIFTERDVLNKLYEGEVDDRAPIDRFMTPNPAALTVEATLGEAVRLMAERGYRHVALEDRNGRSVGCLSSHDIVRYVAEHFPTEVANLPPGLRQDFATPEGA